MEQSKQIPKHDGDLPLSKRAKKAAKKRLAKESVPKVADKPKQVAKPVEVVPDDSAKVLSLEKAIREALTRAEKDFQNGARVKTALLHLDKVDRMSLLVYVKEKIKTIISIEGYLTSIKTGERFSVFRYQSGDKHCDVQLVNKWDPDNEAWSYVKNVFIILEGRAEYIATLPYGKLLAMYADTKLNLKHSKNPNGVVIKASGVEIGKGRTLDEAATVALSLDMAHVLSKVDKKKEQISGGRIKEVVKAFGHSAFTTPNFAVHDGKTYIILEGQKYFLVNRNMSQSAFVDALKNDEFFNDLIKRAASSKPEARMTQLFDSTAETLFNSIKSKYPSNTVRFVLQGSDPASNRTSASFTGKIFMGQSVFYKMTGNSPSRDDFKKEFFSRFKNSNSWTQFVNMGNKSAIPKLVAPPQRVANIAKAKALRASGKNFEEIAVAMGSKLQPGIVILDDMSVTLTTQIGGFNKDMQANMISQGIDPGLWTDCAMTPDERALADGRRQRCIPRMEKLISDARVFATVTAQKLVGSEWRCIMTIAGSSTVISGPKKGMTGRILKANSTKQAVFSFVRGFYPFDKNGRQTPEAKSLYDAIEEAKTAKVDAQNSASWKDEQQVHRNHKGAISFRNEDDAAHFSKFDMNQHDEREDQGYDNGYEEEESHVDFDKSVVKTVKNKKFSDQHVLDREAKGIRGHDHVRRH